MVRAGGMSVGVLLVVPSSPNFVVSPDLSKSLESYVESEEREYA